MGVAIVGLGFGEAFLPIYLDHPDVADLAVVEPDAERRESVGAAHGIEARHASIEDLLADDHWDAVHIAAPVRFHAEYSIATLDAGKHCACAVPMATTLDDIDAIGGRPAPRRSHLHDDGDLGLHPRVPHRSRPARPRALGELTMYRGFHIQNLDGFAWYWQGYPPMHYVTHALSPILALLDTTAWFGTSMSARRILGLE